MSRDAGRPTTSPLLMAGSFRRLGLAQCSTAIEMMKPVPMEGDREKLGDGLDRWTRLLHGATDSRVRQALQDSIRETEAGLAALERMPETQSDF